MAEATLSFSVTGNKVSSVSGYNYISVSFSSDRPYKAFQCRATRVNESWGVGIGELIASFSETPANVVRTFDIYNTYLVRGDGTYRISLLAQSEDGEWNTSATVIPEFEFPFDCEVDSSGFIFGAIQDE